MIANSWRNPLTQGGEVAAGKYHKMGGTGFEPVKALPSDLQSDPFDRSGNSPEYFAQDLSTHRQNLRPAMTMETPPPTIELPLFR